MSSEQQARGAEITTPTDRQIRIERTFDAPRERVWEAYTDPALIVQWWGGPDGRTVLEEMDVRVGGRWRMVETMPDGSQTAFRGVYREIIAPERISQTFEWEGMPGHVSVETATFEDLGDGRTRVVTVSTFHFPEERDGMLASGMEQGLNASYARLDALLAR